MKSSPIPTVGFPFVGDTVGGSHVSTLLLMQELQQFGFRAIGLVHKPGPLTRHLTAEGIEFLQTGLPYLDYGKSGIKALGYSFYISLQIATFVRRNNIALIHVNDGRMIASWTLASRLSACPIVLHARHRWSPSRLAYMCYQIAKERIAISAYVRDSMPPSISRNTRIVTNPFVSSTADYPSARQGIFEIIGRERGLLVAFVGTLMEQKRPSIFLKTAADLSRKTEAHFVLFGRSGDCLNALKKQAAQLGILERVTFAGFRQDFKCLLAGFDLLIAPAVNEGHGRALVEAMLARVPVIAANSGGHGEIIEDHKTGLLVTPDNPEAFSTAAMLVLSENNFREKIVENAWAWASSAFSPRHHAEQIASVYRSLSKAL